MHLRMSNAYREYTSSLEKQLRKIYSVAEKARERGLDPSLTCEPEIARDLAGLVEGLVGPKGVAESLRALSQKLPREELAFKIAEQIVYGKFGRMNPQEAAEQAVRTALAIFTEGITAAPLQGVARVLIKDNPDRTKYLAIYFAGPIRSAGGTDQALTIVTGDFVRHLLGLDRYKPTEEEVARFIEELRLYERSRGRFQYKVSDEQLRNALQSLPVEVTGTESDPVEVSTYRNLPRIETNRVRGGALRVVNDGLVGRSPKVWTIVEKLGIEGWEWLKRIREISEKKTASFMEEVIAGRPIFSFPSRHGGFRLRYGRARNTGLAALGVNPATMMVLQHFIAAGTQLRIEGPGKAGVALPVDTIEPPVVRLRDGSVVRVSVKGFDQIRDKIDRILFLGDLLISFGDFLYTNRTLPQSGYTEEWWAEELQRAIPQDFNDSVENYEANLGISLLRLREFLANPTENKPSVLEAIALASSLHIPLHPAFTYFWHSISTEAFQTLRRWFLSTQVQDEDGFICKIVGSLDEQVKRLLERICVPHSVVDNEICLEGDDAHACAFCLGLHVPKIRVHNSKSVSETIKQFTGVTVREKAPSFVGARMGRPEKAKRREMKPLVHVLFPVGLIGGSQRNIVEASSKEIVSVDLVKRRCPVCREATRRIRCPKCEVETIVEKFCPQCKRNLKEGACPICKVRARSYERQSINLKNLLTKACKRLNFPPPSLVKGVRGLTNESKTAEILEKGVLRAKHDLSVYKDGTLRFDATNAPLTHFKVTETGVSLERLRDLGYTCDCSGDALKNQQQMCELKIQDVIIPLKCAKYFVRIANFLDELLEKVYNLPPFYNVKQADDLVGHLLVGLAPHTSVGILGRIIGFTNLNLCYAHPLWHSAKRRDCDGDEDALMLALDTVLNFSKAYLPAQIGGMMDAPFFIIPVVNPAEVQRQAHEIEVVNKYPLIFYEKTLKEESPQDMRSLFDMIEHRLGTEAQFESFGYTIPVSDISLGNRESMYKRLGSMVEKMNMQLLLAEKIEAVEARKVALRVLTTHFMRDISGNLRAFTSQRFRCKICSRKFRRMPLGGKCPECRGDMTLTVHRGGIEKYLEVARNLVKKYELPDYYAQRLELVQEEIGSLFDGKKPKQISLEEFVA